jgi:hypothetical protein
MRLLLLGPAWSLPSHDVDRFRGNSARKQLSEENNYMRPPLMDAVTLLMVALEKTCDGVWVGLRRVWEYVGN